MAGYSPRPLAEKLGIRSGIRLYLVQAPEGFLEALGPLPDNVTFLRRLSGRIDLIHLFATRADTVAERLPVYRRRMAENGAVWVSWPKKVARVETDLTEEVVRDIALPLGLVDTKVCAVDAIWSALRLVIRVAHRRAERRDREKKRATEDSRRAGSQGSLEAEHG